MHDPLSVADQESLDYVPRRSRFAEAVSGVHDLSRTGCTWEAAVVSVIFGYDHSRISELASRTTAVAQKGR